MLLDSADDTEWYQCQYSSTSHTTGINCVQIQLELDEVTKSTISIDFWIETNLEATEGGNLGFE